MADRPPTLFQKSFALPSPKETSCLAAALAPRLHPGDVILMEGPVGAGKTHFARSLIQSILEIPEDVPSPTFTLVQAYETSQGSLWHADLYRIGSVQEVEELGLTEAFDTAISLVEWPDRLGLLWPQKALHLQFEDGDAPSARKLTASSVCAKWRERLQGWSS